MRSYEYEMSACGAAELVHDTSDLPYTYKGEAVVITAVTSDFCPACAECILDLVESDQITLPGRIGHDHSDPPAPLLHATSDINTQSLSG